MADPAAALAALKAGGHVVYIRHADEGRDSRDSSTEWWRCGATLAVLSDEGRAQARAVGEGFRRNGIKVDRVLSSEYCRVEQTAELLHLGPVTLDPGLNGHRSHESRGVAPASVAVPETTKRLSNPPEPSANTVLVSHIHTFGGAEDPTLRSIAQAEAAVFRPDRRGGYSLVGRIRYDEWLRSTAGR